jgi:hypothetical protein
MAGKGEGSLEACQSAATARVIALEPKLFFLQRSSCGGIIVMHGEAIVESGNAMRSFAISARLAPRR